MEDKNTKYFSTERPAKKQKEDKKTIPTMESEVFSLYQSICANPQVQAQLDALLLKLREEPNLINSLLHETKPEQNKEKHFSLETKGTLLH
jgi:hypothetical protein